ncbi:hypothetical protein [Salinisphaera aquimarina]|uniref:Uncharacterized protein n=1 Tax=Salinisphaera aquimarina TaxID=2094031 RepID=A0ABV7EST1_9GAMM
MARSWLEVTTDEVQSKLGANKRLADRREAIAERARAAVRDVAAPVFEQAAAQGDWQYREEHDTEWSVVRCGIHGPGELDRDPTVAFYMAEFDAYQPLVVLRHKARGAAEQPSSRIVSLDELNQALLEAFIQDA